MSKHHCGQQCIGFDAPPAAKTDPFDYVTITTSEYGYLLRVAERAAILERLIEHSAYMPDKEVVLDVLGVEEGGEASE